MFGPLLDGRSCWRNQAQHNPGGRRRSGRGLRRNICGAGLGTSGPVLPTGRLFFFFFVFFSFFAFATLAAKNPGARKTPTLTWCSCCGDAHGLRLFSRRPFSIGAASWPLEGSAGPAAGQPCSWFPNGQSRLRSVGSIASADREKNSAGTAAMWPALYSGSGRALGAPPGVILLSKMERALRSTDPGRDKSGTAERPSFIAEIGGADLSAFGKLATCRRAGSARIAFTRPRWVRRHPGIVNRARGPGKFSPGGGALAGRKKVGEWGRGFSCVRARCS